MMSRHWQCLNHNCCHVFHSYEHGNPECPRCRCVRVQWVPGGGHVGKQYRQLDASLRSLAESFGMTNINSASPSRLNRSMPKHDPVKADGPVKQFAPGFAAPYNTQGRATCEPSRDQSIDFKVRAGVDSMLTPTNVPSIGRSNWKTMRRAFK